MRSKSRSYAYPVAETFIAAALLASPGQRSKILDNHGHGRRHEQHHERRDDDAETEADRHRNKELGLRACFEKQRRETERRRQRRQ